MEGCSPVTKTPSPTRSPPTPAGVRRVSDFPRVGRRRPGSRWDGDQTNSGFNHRAAPEEPGRWAPPAPSPSDIPRGDKELKPRGWAHPAPTPWVINRGGQRGGLGGSREVEVIVHRSSASVRLAAAPAQVLLQALLTPAAQCLLVQTQSLPSRVLKWALRLQFGLLVG